MDGRIECDHGAGHGVAGRVGVKAAVNVDVLGEQRGEPARVGTSASGRKAPMLGMKGVATDGVDGRLAKDDGGSGNAGGRNGEDAPIFLGTPGHPAPRVNRGSAQFGADGSLIGGTQDEARIGSGIGSREIAKPAVGGPIAS